MILKLLISFFVLSHASKVLKYKTIAQFQSKILKLMSSKVKTTTFSKKIQHYKKKFSQNFPQILNGQFNGNSILYEYFSQSDKELTKNIDLFEPKLKILIDYGLDVNKPNSGNLSVLDKLILELVDSKKEVLDNYIKILINYGCTCKARLFDQLYNYKSPILINNDLKRLIENISAKKFDSIINVIINYENLYNLNYKFDSSKVNQCIFNMLTKKEYSKFEKILKVKSIVNNLSDDTFELIIQTIIHNDDLIGLDYKFKDSNVQNYFEKLKKSNDYKSIVLVSRINSIFDLIKEKLKVYLNDNENLVNIEKILDSTKDSKLVEFIHQNVEIIKQHLGDIEKYKEFLQSPQNYLITFILHFNESNYLKMKIKKLDETQNKEFIEKLKGQLKNFYSRHKIISFIVENKIDINLSFEEAKDLIYSIYSESNFPVTFVREYLCKFQDDIKNEKEKLKKNSSKGPGDLVKRYSAGTFVLKLNKVLNVCMNL